MLNKTINGFTIKRKIEPAGGMAEVWYAENRLGRKAAIKIMLKKFMGDSGIEERFNNEALTMEKLHHPYICSVLDLAEIDERPCIIMEFLEGEDLAKIIASKQPVASGDIIKWWNQITEALDFTHKKGIIHRDIKPSNIFITNEGNVKLLDFGVAKTNISDLTVTGQAIGTERYMSPEQVINSKHLDYKTDNYSLAVTFYHLLTGERPYDATTSTGYELQSKIMSEPLNIKLLPAEWANFLGGYLYKKAG